MNSTWIFYPSCNLSMIRNQWVKFNWCGFMATWLLKYRHRFKSRLGCANEIPVKPKRPSTSAWILLYQITYGTEMHSASPRIPSRKTERPFSALLPIIKWTSPNILTCQVISIKLCQFFNHTRLQSAGKPFTAHTYHTEHCNYHTPSWVQLNISSKACQTLRLDCHLVWVET